MPSHGDRTGRDTLDAILQRIADLESEVHQLQGGHRVSMDRGDANSLTVDKGAFEGQTLIQYADSDPYKAEGSYYFSNGEWRPFWSGVNLNPDQSRYECTSLTVPAGSSANVPFTQTSTDGIFDLASPAAPVALLDGAYAVAAVVIGGSGWTPGSYLTGIMSFAASYQISVRHQVIADAAGHMPTFSLSQTWRVGAGNGFWIELQSGDGADQDVDVQPISAFRIAEYI